MIKVKNLSVKFTKEYSALDNLNLQVAKGEKLAVFGEDGSGKTTFLRVLSKLQKISSGEVYVKGISIKKIDYATDVSLGYLPVKPVFKTNKTVFANLKMFKPKKLQSSYETEESIRNTLAEFGVSDLENVKIKNLSLFEQYIISLARLSFRNLDLLLIDNIFNKLNQTQTETIIELFGRYLANDNLTMIVATSNENLAARLSQKQIKFLSGGTEENVNKR